MADDSTQSVLDVVLNGLEICLDADTGAILSLNYPGPGQMLGTQL